MNQSPQIKPTSIKGGDANPKVVENWCAKVVADTGTQKLADMGWGRPTCPYGRWAPPSVAHLLVSSRFFSTWF
jgi:hypothetical protein